MYLSTVYLKVTTADADVELFVFRRLEQLEDVPGRVGVDPTL